jgi:hypothetical protein
MHGFRLQKPIKGLFIHLGANCSIWMPFDPQLFTPPDLPWVGETPTRGQVALITTTKNLNILTNNNLRLRQRPQLALRLIGADFSGETKVPEERL